MHTRRRWMERRAAALAVTGGLVAGATLGCSEDTESNDEMPDAPSAAPSDTDAPAPAMGEPGPGAFDPSFESSTAFFTRMSSTEDSNIHYQQRTWYSQNLADFPRQGPFIAPEGSVAIKTEATDAGEHFTTMVMIKREAGYDPEGNDWYYEVRNPDGSLDESPAPGRIGLCRSCHAGGQATDYLLAFDIEN